MTFHNYTTEQLRKRLEYEQYQLSQTRSADRLKRHERAIRQIGVELTRRDKQAQAGR